MRFQADEEIRLDNYLAKVLDESRSQVSKIIKSGNVFVNNKITKAGLILKNGDIIDVNYQSEDDSIIPEEMDLDILLREIIMVLW